MSESNEPSDITPHEEQLTDENLDAVSGGVIDGGCIPPLFPKHPIPGSGPFWPPRSIPGESDQVL